MSDLKSKLSIDQTNVVGLINTLKQHSSTKTKTIRLELLVNDLVEFSHEFEPLKENEKTIYNNINGFMSNFIELENENKNIKMCVFSNHEMWLSYDLNEEEAKDVNIWHKLITTLDFFPI